jgi:hypothetical protein
VEFEPTISVFERAKTVHALDGSAIVIGTITYNMWNYYGLRLLTVHLRFVKLPHLMFRKYKIQYLRKTKYILGFIKATADDRETCYQKVYRHNQYYMQPESSALYRCTVQYYFM